MARPGESERATGKKWHREIAEFAECVMYLKLESKGKHTWDERWAEGIWLGVREESGEIFIGTKDEVLQKIFV